MNEPIGLRVHAAHHINGLGVIVILAVFFAVDVEKALVVHGAVVVCLNPAERVGEVVAVGTLVAH